MKVSKPKQTLTRMARRKLYAPKHARQSFTISKSNTKIRHGVSKSETEWLNKLNVPERSKLVHGFGNKIMILDGYDPVKKISFEYNGLAFHGHHKVYPKDRDKIIPWLKKTPNQLYFGTIDRYNFLHSMGIKVFFVWEDDYKAGKSIGRFYRGPGDNLY